MTTPEIISLLGAISAALAAIAAFGVWYYSSKQNKLSQKANELSQKQYEADFPHFEPISLTHKHDKDNFKPYSTTTLHGHHHIDKNSTPELWKLVEDCRGTLSMQTLAEEEYLLINIIDREKSLDDVQLYLGILDTVFTNVLRPARSFSIINAKSTLHGGASIKLKVIDPHLEIIREETSQHIHVKVAYAHTAGCSPSIKTERFVQATGDIEFLGAKNAKNTIKYFNFADTAFQTQVIDSAGYVQTQTVHIKVDDKTGRLYIIIDDDPLD